MLTVYKQWSELSLTPTKPGDNRGQAQKGFATQTKRVALGSKTSPPSAIQPRRMNYNWHRFNPMGATFLHTGSASFF